jgi:hypothetical protein
MILSNQEQELYQAMALLDDVRNDSLRSPKISMERLLFKVGEHVIKNSKASGKLELFLAEIGWKIEYRKEPSERFPRTLYIAKGHLDDKGCFDHNYTNFFDTTNNNIGYFADGILEDYTLIFKSVTKTRVGILMPNLNAKTVLENALHELYGDKQIVDYGVRESDIETAKWRKCQSAVNNSIQKVVRYQEEKNPVEPKPQDHYILPAFLRKILLRVNS